MEIPSDLRPPDPPRRRIGEASRPAGGQEPTPTSGESTDSVRLSAPAPEVIAGWVAALKDLAPERLHRVEELRARIADGSYTADPEDLAGPLLDHLDGSLG
jgi:flagellar biosynthesis anti-sigma factor FlgM